MCSAFDPKKPWLKLAFSVHHQSRVVVKKKKKKLKRPSAREFYGHAAPHHWSQSSGWRWRNHLDHVGEIQRKDRAVDSLGNVEVDVLHLGCALGYTVSNRSESCALENGLKMEQIKEETWGDGSRKGLSACTYDWAIRPLLPYSLNIWDPKGKGNVSNDQQHDQGGSHSENSQGAYDKQEGTEWKEDMYRKPSLLTESVSKIQSCSSRQME